MSLFISLNAGGFDHLAPVLVFLVDQCLELRRTLVGCYSALLFHLALELIALDNLADFRRQALDHLRRRFSRGEEPEPGGDLVAWYARLRRSWDLVVQWVPLVARVGKSLELAAADMCDERGGRRVDEFDAPPK